MEPELIQWLKQPTTGARSRYAGDRGICLEHDTPRNNCKPCITKKVRRSDDIRMRAENSLYRFELNVSEPLLMLALCLNSDPSQEQHHPYFINGSGSLHRSGLITGVIKSSPEKTILEHDNHEVLVVKQSGVRNAFRYRLDIIDTLQRELEAENQLDPLLGEVFKSLRSVKYPDERLVPPSELRICFFFVPLVGEYKNALVKISDPVSFMRRPQTNSSVSGSKRSRHNSVAQSLASDYSESAIPQANFRFPTVPRDLADLVRDARASFVESRPILRPPAEQMPLRSYLRQRLADRAATRSSVWQIEPPTPSAQNSIIEDTDANVEMVDEDVDIEMLLEFDAYAEASALFTPAISAFASCNLVDAQHEPENTLNSLMPVHEISDSDIEEMQRIANEFEPVEEMQEIANEFQPVKLLQHLEKPLPKEQRTDLKHYSYLSDLRSSDFDLEDFNALSFAAPEELTEEDSCSLGDVEPFAP